MRVMTIAGKAVDPTGLQWRAVRKKPVVVKAVQITQPFSVQTLEGTMLGNAFDWLICGVNDELYPCKPDIFDKTYEADHER